METKKTTIWVVLAVLLVVIIVGILIANRNTAQVTENNQTLEEEMFEKTVDLKHQYKDGKHIFAGTIEVPTPCYKVNLEITPGEVAELNFTTVDSGEVCAQVITNANFYAEFEAPENQLFVGKLNGEPVNLNQFEVDSDMDINEVDIFLKG